MKKINELVFSWWEKLISKNVISANDAYTSSKFGSNENINKNTKRVISDINKTIHFKTQIKKYSLIHDLEDENVLIENIIQYFENLGYNVLLLNNELNEKITGEYIFITWMKKINQSNEKNINDENLIENNNN